MSSRSRSDDAGAPRDVLDDIYDSATDPAAFERLGVSLARATRSSVAVFMLRERGIVTAVSTTTSAEAQDAYLAHYQHVDIWRPLAAAEALTVLPTEAVISDEDILRSEFYADYGRHLGMFRPVGTTAWVTPEINLSVGLSRAQGAASYDAGERAQLVDLARHLQRAMQLRHRLGMLGRTASAGYGALDALVFGVVIADAEGRAVFVNEVADKLQREGAGIILPGGRFAAANARETLRLASLITGAARGGPGGALVLHRADGSPSLFCLVSQLPRRLSETGASEGLALVALRRIDDDTGLAETVLKGLFGLSPAEAQVSLAILGGRQVEEIAAARGVRPSTLKTQLDAIFRKTGADNRRELVRLLGKLPQLRTPGGGSRK